MVGKPNVGKSTLFNALTLLDAAIAPYPFTTLKPNRGVGAVRVRCPHMEKGRPCDPGNARCTEGTRWVPVSLVDVPGLVPGAHHGKGLGYQFLDDLRAADGFIQVIDASGGTSPEGELAPPGSYDPTTEVAWLEEELVRWVASILTRDFDRHVKTVELEGGKVEEFLAQRLTGLAIPPPAITTALRQVGLDRAHPSHWSTDDRLRLARALLRTAKPRLVAANKSDRLAPAVPKEIAEKLRPLPCVPTSAESELVLRRAARAGLVQYTPGSSSFVRGDPAKLNEAQRHALDRVEDHLHRYGSTGVQSALEEMVFVQLQRIVVFPVEDETHWTDSKGRLLPDAYLLPTGTVARQMAYRVHTDLGEGFVRAIDGRTHRALGADHPLENGAVIRIVSHR